MRLDPEQITWLDPTNRRNQSGGPVAAPSTMLQAALTWAAMGYEVFPLQERSKEPKIKNAHPAGSKWAGGKCKGDCGKDGHGVHDGTTDPVRIKKWWTTWPNANIGWHVAEDRIVIDIDPRSGGEMPDLPDTLTFYSGRSDGGAHLIYQVGAGVKLTGLPVGVDQKRRGGYIVLPPSIHPDTGLAYWAGQDWPLDKPPAVLEEAEVTKWLGEQQKVTEGQREDSSGVVRSMLSSLLATPDNSARNVWLSRVAGHYAKRFDEEDLYRTQCEIANNLLSPPLDQAEWDKTVSSIWRAEKTNHAEREAKADNGWLVGNGKSLFCQVAKKEGDGTVYELAPYSDFDLTALGVAIDSEWRRVYWVDLHWNGAKIPATVEGSVLGDDRMLRKWLSSYGATMAPPANAWPKDPPGTRIQRYLNSQTPPEVKIVKALGWNDEAEGYITHEGVIREDGQVSKEDAGVVADPGLLATRTAPYRYGFERSAEEARRVLREVLTFHHPEVTSVFGAWWAACLLKAQMFENAALFPFMAIEAPSESGKTNGFFRLMIELNGNTKGENQPTKAALRDLIGAHRNGIVWVDDLDDPKYLLEVLRAATSEGTLSKKGEDRTSNIDAKMLAPVVLSGESLGLNVQKALIDRAVQLKVTSPTDRMSVKDPQVAQWEDILALQREYQRDGGLHALAGWYVQQAIVMKDHAVQYLRDRRQGKGRAADKHAILEAGAALLDALVAETPEDMSEAWEGHGRHGRYVSEWVRSARAAAPDHRENALTLEVLPWALRKFKYPDKPYAAEKDSLPDTPIYLKVDDEGEALEVWFDVQGIANAWEHDKRGQVAVRTHSHDALMSQAAALGCDKKRTRIVGSRRLAWYRKVDGPIAQQVLDRARGGSAGGSAHPEPITFE